MSIIQPRSEWTATKEGFSYALRPDTVTGFAIHYPGIGNVTTAGRSDDWAKQQLRNYRAYHVNTRGWADIGYNIAISQNGTAWWAAGKKKAAHCASKSNPTANARHVGILLIIGNSERPTAAMVTTLNRVIAEVQAEFPGARTILGHREVPGASTACPGDVVIAMIHDKTIRPATPPTGGIGGGMSPIPATPTAPAPTPTVPEEDQMTPEQAWTLTNVSNAVGAIQQQTWAINNILANAVLPALKGLGADIKALPELDAATIAALVPNGLAQAVADELHKRLAG